MTPQPPSDPTLLLGFIRIPVLIVSVIAAALSVLLDIKRHSFWTAILAIVSGALVALICTEPVVAFLNARGGEHAIAGTLGVAGRNLVVWVQVTSRDPLALINALRGKK